MDHSPGVGGDVRAGTDMAPVLEKNLEFNGTDSDGIWNTSLVGATGTCATGHRGDPPEIGTAIPRVRDPVGCAAKPLVGQELPPESGGTSDPREGGTFRVLHST